jgi:hypothetical protein
MIRSREKRNRRPRRARRHEGLLDHRVEPLPLLVRILARRAAREQFEREVAADREAQPEVTLHRRSPSTPDTRRTTSAKRRSRTSSGYAGSSRLARGGRSLRRSPITRSRAPPFCVPDSRH